MRRMARAKKFVLLLISALSFSLVLGACSGEGGTQSQDTNPPITVGVDYPPSSLDPYLSNWGGQYAAYLYPVYDTLIREEPDGTLSPNLATSWEYTTPLNFEIKLRTDAKFNDGTPVDAEAVKANLDRLKTVNGPRVSRMEAIKEVKVVDPQTLSLTLSSPNPSLPLEFSQLFGMIVDPSALDNTDLATAPVGSGPYVLDTSKTVKDSKYIYTRNPDYWNSKAFPFDTLILQVYPDQNSMLNAIRSGEVAVGYGSSDTVSAAESAGLKVVTKPINAYMIFLSDREGKLVPALGDVKVRQALNYAVDRDAILKAVFNGQGKSTTQIFPPGSDGYSADLDSYYKFDPEKAKTLLAEAGYPDGFTFETALPAASRDGTYAQALAGFFENVGVTMKIVPLPPGSLTLDNVSKYPTWISRYGGQDTFSDARSLVMPPAALVNTFGTQDKNFEATWSIGTEATTEDARKQAYTELSRQIVEAAWFVPTTLSDAIYFVDPKKVSGVEFTNGVSVPQIFGWSHP